MPHVLSLVLETLSLISAFQGLVLVAPRTANNHIFYQVL